MATQDDLDRIDRAIAGTAKSVTIEGRRVDYKDTADLMRIRGEVARQVDAAAGTLPVRRVKLYSTKDL